MRKDVRFGLTIGAILLAVLVVYVLVVPADRPQQGVQLETLNPDGTPAAPVEGAAPETPSETAIATPARPEVAEPVAPTEPEVTRTPVVESTDKVDWHAILNGRSAAAVDTVTPPVTPGPGPAPRERFIPQPPSEPAVAAPSEPSRSATAGGDVIARDLPATPATYKVESGDNLWTISKKVFGDGRHASEIQKANPGLNPSRLKIGQELKLPDRTALQQPAAPAAPATDAPVDTTKQYRVQRGDSLHKIAQRLYGTDAMADDLYQLNQQTIGTDPAKLKVGMVLDLPNSPNTTTAGAR